MGFAQDTTLKMQSEIVRVKSMADTSRFTPNTKSDWSLFNSYVGLADKDSVVFEAIISHSRDIDWTTYQLFGRIKDKSMLPNQPQEVGYMLLTDRYMVKVDVNGDTYIRLSEGQLPGSAPIVLPIKIAFK